MGHKVNRGAEILKNWDRYQLALKNSTGDGMPDRSVKREKYNFLVAGLARLSVQPSMDERIYSSMIAAMVKRLRKEIYPNPLIRALVRFLDQVLRMPKIKRDLQRKKQENFSALDKIVKNMGIDNMSGYLAAQLDHERSSVSLSLVSRFHGDSNIELSLNIEKDGNGYYQIDHVEASLFTDGERNKHCVIDGRYGLQVDHIYHLLMGEAVMITKPGNEGSEKWVQLDFSRTDQNGHSHLREHHVEPGCELDKLLKAASENIGFVGIDRPEILKVLTSGAQAVFRVEGLGVFSLEACPRNSVLVFRDGQQQVIPVVSLKQRIADHKLLRSSQQPVIKKLKTKKSLDQGRAFGL